MKVNKMNTVRATTIALGLTFAGASFAGQEICNKKIGQEKRVVSLLDANVAGTQAVIPIIRFENYQGKNFGELYMAAAVGCKDAELREIGQKFCDDGQKPEQLECFPREIIHTQFIEELVGQEV